MSGRGGGVDRSGATGGTATATATSLQGEAADRSGAGGRSSDPAQGRGPHRAPATGASPAVAAAPRTRADRLPAAGSGAETQGTCSQGDPTSPSTCALALYLVTSLKTELSPFPLLPPPLLVLQAEELDYRKLQKPKGQPARKGKGHTAGRPSTGAEPRPAAVHHQTRSHPGAQAGSHDLHPKPPRLRPGHQSSTADGPASTSSEPGLWIWF